MTLKRARLGGPHLESRHMRQLINMEENVSLQFSCVVETPHNSGNNGAHTLPLTAEPPLKPAVIESRVLQILLLPSHSAMNLPPCIFASSLTPRRCHASSREEDVWRLFIVWRAESAIIPKSRIIKEQR